MVVAFALPAFDGRAQVDIPEVTLNFPEMIEVGELAKAASFWLGKPILIDNRVGTKKVQIVAPKPIPQDEAYLVFLSALDMLDLTVVETGKLIKIVPKKNAKQDGSRVFQTGSMALGTDQIVTQVIPLRYGVADNVAKALKPIFDSGSVVSLPRANSLVVTDTGHNIARALDIVSVLDARTHSPVVQFVPLVHIDAKVAKDRVTELVKSNSSALTGEFRIVVEEKSNSLVVLALPKDVKTIRDIAKKMDMPTTGLNAGLALHVLPLQFQSVKDIIGPLQALLNSREKDAKNDSDGVVLSSYEETNSLLVKANLGQLREVTSLLRKLDQRQAQVLIEAHIFLVDLNDSNSWRPSALLGIAAGAAAKVAIGWEAQSVVPLALSATGFGSLTEAMREQKLSSLNRDMQVGILPATKVDIPGIGEISPGLLLSLMYQDGNTKNIARPSVLANDNTEAQLAVGTTLFFESHEVTATTVAPKVEKEKAELDISLKPKVSPNNSVTVEVAINDTVLVGVTPNGLPRMANRKAKTNIVLKNGQTAIISGLDREMDSVTESRVPGLGSIPILGAFFRSSQKELGSSRLAIFLTAHVIRSDQDLQRLAAQKFKNEFGLVDRRH